MTKHVDPDQTAPKEQSDLGLHYSLFSQQISDTPQDIKISCLKSLGYSLLSMDGGMTCDFTSLSQQYFSYIRMTRG